MSIKFNDQVLLWGLGVIQPATPEEIVSFLNIVYPNIGQWPDCEMLKSIFESWMKNDYVICLNKKHQLYSLTANANTRLGVKLRRQRDKARITLLRDNYDASLKMSEAVEQGLGGASPSIEVRLATQEGSRPVNSGSEPSRTESTRLRARIYWPRVSEQLNIRVGLGFHASDIPSYRFRYCSYPTLQTLQEASLDTPIERDMSLSQLALAIGVSPRLLTSFTHKSDNHYRRFSIGKKGGGEREIASPRFFLKTIQYWIKSYMLCHLNIHDSCHAFLPRKSIQSNAEQHVGKSYVANIDIENFFGSITKNHVSTLLIKNGLGEELSGVISRLVTLDGSLPQGAPTSPDISNAFLFDFDETVNSVVTELGLSYTRYADDITISGESKKDIESSIDRCKKELSHYDLYLKDKKTRVSSNRSSQRVTGLVVNEKVQPPRDYLRKVRAIFHNAYINPEEYTDRIDELRGYFGYLSGFDALKGSRHLRRYKLIITKVSTHTK